MHINFERSYITAKVIVKKINQEKMLEHIRAIKSAKVAIKELEEQIKESQNAITKNIAFVYRI